MPATICVPMRISIPPLASPPEGGEVLFLGRVLSMRAIRALGSKALTALSTRSVPKPISARRPLCRRGTQRASGCFDRTATHEARPPSMPGVGTEQASQLIASHKSGRPRRTQNHAGSQRGWSAAWPQGSLAWLQARTGDHAISIHSGLMTQINHLDLRHGSVMNPLRQPQSFNLSRCTFAQLSDEGVAVPRTTGQAACRARTRARFEPITGARVLLKAPRAPRRPPQGQAWARGQRAQNARR